MTEPTPILEARQVTKKLGGNEVLRGVSFAVAKGGVTALIGASGSGKSTLLRCLNCLVLPDSGEILFEGKRVGVVERGGRLRPQPERELLAHRSEIGMVFQSYNLFPHLTALENIIEAPMIVRRRGRKEAAEAARELLAKIRLLHRADAYPHQMSGGEQQRVAIARALAMQPRAMLFDEVTSALDPELKGEVLTVIRDLAAEGMTMILVSHEMGFVRQVAQEVLFMSQGVIRERGGPGDLFERPGTPELKTFIGRIVD
jgi:ABC-type polar amino acid transport system ATPase subunit